ncbi:MAG: DNA cytosine methyltransferase [Acidimicrobiia bacterium]|nr:DNA cytosine methyltransferase [Acidimicrobiia bacterium]MYB75373.1 DNA cytosine methyltransferase [Acidimicrobiia bacterium]MYH98519.1 DNA cytosine methyltransferase [Acidimicrobiia bacterium]
MGRSAAPKLRSDSRASGDGITSYSVLSQQGNPDIVLADFFAGCGGTARGFADVGIVPALAVEWDPDAAESYRRNFPATSVLERDIRSVSVKEIRSALPPKGGTIRLFAGCAPCQPFAGHRNGQSVKAPESSLLFEFLRFVGEFLPELVFIENVPGMQRSSDVLAEFVKEIQPFGYDCSGSIICSADYGVPQARKRFVLVASRLGKIELPRPIRGDGAPLRHLTVRDAIHDLPPVEAGCEHPELPDHRTMRLSLRNLQRIRATPEGGDRRDWPERLWPDCHRGQGINHTDAYGRLSWDRPAPTLTTRCISYSNGRYGHPEQDRALTVREAARLQTFPDHFEFAGGLTSQAKQIGNAVPVELARNVGRSLVDHAMIHA